MSAQLGAVATLDGHVLDLSQLAALSWLLASHNPVIRNSAGELVVADPDGLAQFVVYEAYPIIDGPSADLWATRLGVIAGLPVAARDELGFAETVRDLVVMGLVPILRAEFEADYGHLLLSGAWSEYNDELVGQAVSTGYDPAAAVQALMVHARVAALQ